MVRRIQARPRLESWPLPLTRLFLCLQTIRKCVGDFLGLRFQLVLVPNDPVGIRFRHFILSVTLMTVDLIVIPTKHAIQSFSKTLECLVVLFIYDPKVLYGSSPTRCSRPMNLGSGRRLSNIGSTLSKTNRESRSTRALSSHAKACSLSPSAA